MSTRLETLQSLLAQDPQNTFMRYGLAMEYINQGQLEQALPEFEQVLTANPQYGAAYFHGGQTWEKLGRFDAAREMYQRGIAATIQSGDDHTRSELEAALDALGG